MLKNVQNCHVIQLKYCFYRGLRSQTAFRGGPAGHAWLWPTPVIVTMTWQILSVYPGPALGYYFSQRIAYMILQYRTVHSWGICTVRYFLTYATYVCTRTLFYRTRKKLYIICPACVYSVCLRTVGYTRQTSRHELACTLYKAFIHFYPATRPRFRRRGRLSTTSFPRHHVIYHIATCF